MPAGSILPHSEDEGMTDSQNELEGRVAVVTGAGRNIGRAIAIELAAGGAAVVVNVRSNKDQAAAVVKEIEAAGGTGLAVIGDVAKPAEVEAMVAAAVKTFGRIDYLINNAGLRAEKPLDLLSFDDWRAIMGVNLDGAFHCVKACLPQLKASGAGSIINIGGISAHTGAKNRVHVVASKAGLVGFTRALAHDLAEFNVTANLIAPGFIARERAPGQIPAHHGRVGAITGREADAVEIGTMARFLCGPGSRFITGQTIHVNGGAYLG
jgi:3-oxoacyl-[acyl-carrier protein] reductase